MSLKNMARGLPGPIKELVKRKLNERGLYDIRDIRIGLAARGFYDIRGVHEIKTIDEFKEQAFAIQKRARLQTQVDVIALKRKYEQPIFGEIAVERLLELQAQIIDPTNILMFTGSQLTHTLQVLESMENAGITSTAEFLAMHPSTILVSLPFSRAKKRENLCRAAANPLKAKNLPGSGFENCTFSWDHANGWYMPAFTRMCPRRWRGC